MNDWVLKTFAFEAMKALEPHDRQKALDTINKMANEPVAESDVYLGRGRVANSAYDRSWERFPPELLQQFATTLPGKPVLVAHNKSLPPVGLWYAAGVEKDTAGVAHLVGDFYLDAESEITRRVRMGIAKQLSIGVVGVSRACDLCGQDYLKCSHDVGSMYAEKRCTLTYRGSDRAEAIEASFVGVGCQYGAQVVGTKSFLPGSGVILDFHAGEQPPAQTEDGMEKAELEARVKVLEDENTALKKDSPLAAVGKAYYDDLRARITKKLGILEEDPAPVLSLLAAAELPALKAYDEQLTARIDNKFPPTPVSQRLGEGADLAPPPEGAPKPPQPFDPLASYRGGH